MKRKVKMIGILFALVAIGTFLFFTETLDCIFRDEYKVQTLDAGRHRRIYIYRMSSWEVSIPLSYEVWDGNTKSVERTSFLFIEPIPEFRLVTSEGGDLVAVVSSEAPEVVLILHDFKSGDSWPHGLSHERWNEPSKKGDLLLDRLKAGHPSVRYVLNPYW